MKRIAFLIVSLLLVGLSFIFANKTLATASSGHFNCRWQADMGNKLYCGIDDSKCNTSQGEQPDGSKCAAYTTSDTCNNAPEFPCLTNVPTYQPTGANCANRRGECSSSTYPNCVDDINWATCSGGGSNYCSIPHYVPMGNTSPYSLVSCASKGGPSTPTGTIGSPSNCPVCPDGWAWSYTENLCQKATSSGSQFKDPAIVDCTSSSNTCYPGTGCTSLTGNVHGDCGDSAINTAIGCIPILGPNGQTDFLSFVLKWAVGIGGGVAFLLILYGGFMVMTSSGDPERLKAGQELITSALSGLILLIFSVFILKFIGIDILGLCKFGFGKAC